MTADIIVSQDRALESTLIHRSIELDLQKILSDLNAEKDRIVRAIAALTGMGSSSAGKKTPTKGRRSGRRRGGITPEGRRRLSLAMKRRWAERRKRGA